jgi:hypothetical protein
VKLILTRVIAAAVLLSAAYGQKSKVEKPILPSFSRSAVYMDTGRAAVSPDGQKSVVIRSISDDKAEDFPATVVVRIGNEKLTVRIGFGLNAEVLWSPDSNAFTVSGSRDGVVGLYLTDVFMVDAAGLTRVPLSNVVWRAFGHPVRCGWPEYPNVGAITWLDGSSRLLVAAQIIGHSVCDSNFTFKAYEVEISTQKILRSYNQLEAKKLFKQNLGEWLMAAPDECIRNPKACWVATIHRESKAR